MSIEGWAFLLLRQLPMGQSQLMHLLEPFNHLMPGDENELDRLIERVKRIGHQAENRPGTLSNLLGLRSPADGRGHFHALTNEDPVGLDAPPAFMMHTGTPISSGQQLALPGGWTTWSPDGTEASSSSGVPNTNVL